MEYDLKKNGIIVLYTWNQQNIVNQLYFKKKKKQLKILKLCHPNISLWHIYYFDLKTIKTKKTQKETLTFSLTA